MISTITVVIAVLQVLCLVHLNGGMPRVIAFITRVLRKLAELVLAPDGSLSASKISYLIFVGVFSAKMLATMPDDAWLWFVYGGTVGGVEVAKKYISSRYIGAPSSEVHP